MEFTIGLMVGILIMLAVVAVALFRHRLRASGSRKPLRCVLGFHRMLHLEGRKGLCLEDGCGYKYKNHPKGQEMVRTTGRNFECP